MEDKTAVSLRNNQNEENYESISTKNINNALEKICETNKKWLLYILILTAFPGLLSGMHITSYVFFVDSPHSQYCSIPSLEKANWTSEQIKFVSLPESDAPHVYGCRYYERNYSILASKSFSEAVEIVNSAKTKPELIPCPDYKFENDYTVVKEWNLICDRYYYRSQIQAAFALGKLIGSSFFGLIADKNGRKYSFTIAAWSYLLCGALMVFSNSFYVFLIIRFLVGASGVGCYSTSYTLLSEIVVGPSKVWLCSLVNTSYGFAMIILSCLAYHVKYWWTLQIIMSVPTVILPFYYWLLPESPVWLISKNKYKQAWKIIQNIDCNVVIPHDVVINSYDNVPKKTKTVVSFYHKVGQAFNEIIILFSTSVLRKRTLICLYVWFTVSTTYYGLTLNADNFEVNRYTYMLLNGILEVFCYILPIPLLSVCSRKISSMILFFLTSISLLTITLVHKSFNTEILIMASFGRFCITAAYVTFALYASELFPTAVRNTALGIFFTVAHIGTLCSSYIVEFLGTFKWYMPSTVFGILGMGSLLIVIPLPETKNQPLFNTVEEMKTRENDTGILH